MIGIIIYISIFVIIIPIILYKYKFYEFLEVYMPNFDLLATAVSFRGRTRGEKRTHLPRIVQHKFQQSNGTDQYSAYQLHISTRANLFGCSVSEGFKIDCEGMGYGFHRALLYLSSSKWIHIGYPEKNLRHIF